MLKLRNISSNYLKVAADGIIVVLLTPYVVGELGAAQYAVWIIVQTIGYYLGFFDLGIGDAQVQRHSVLQMRGATDALGRLHGTVLVILIGAGSLAVAVASLLAVLPLAEVFDIPLEWRNDYRLVLPLVGLAILTTFVEAALGGLYESYQRFDLMNTIDVSLAVLEAIATVGVLYFGYGLVGLAMVVVIGSAVAAAVKAVVAWRTFPAYALPRPVFDAESWRAIRSFSLWNCLNDLVTEGTANLDKLLIPILLTSALVTPYSFVAMIAALVFLAAEPITETFFPIASRRHGGNDRVALGVLLSRGSRLVQLTTLPTLIVLLVFGQSILDLWIGDEVDAVEPEVLWFTVISAYFSTYLWTSLSVLAGSGEVRRVFWVSVLEVGGGLILLLTLVPSYGLTGFALAGLVANVVTGLVFFVPSASRRAGVPFVPLVLRTLVVPVAAAAPGLALGVWLAQWLRPESLLATAVCVALTGGVTLGSLLVLVTSRWERARYFAVIRRIVRRDAVVSG